MKGSTMKRIDKFIGEKFTFKSEGIIHEGIFCGIGHVDNNYGMMFIHAKEAGLPLPTTELMLLVPPNKTKCLIIDNNFKNLRKECRHIFKQYNLKCNLGKLVFPIKNVKSMELIND